MYEWMYACMHACMYVMCCDVICCDVMCCDVMWSVVMWCAVMWCDLLWCDVTWCDVTDPKHLENRACILRSGWTTIYLESWNSSSACWFETIFLVSPRMNMFLRVIGRFWNTKKYIFDTQNCKRYAQIFIYNIMYRYVFFFFFFPNIYNIQYMIYSLIF